MFHIASDRIFVIIFFILCHSNVAKVIAIYELNSSLVLFAVGVLRHVTSAPSLAIFRRHLKTHLFRRCFP